ncbi:MAG: 4-hydroxyphenylpyruvate dioxygenase, partial [Bdellovibrionales bacterium]|nr:4-hydroxyphenylpyruvate dioxygenase [Bdellovibrionales bacterium]
LLIDHMTNNVPKGELDKWAQFYENVFNFREIRFFDIKGDTTGLLSRAMRSPCGKITIPINEPTEDKSQIQEYLNEYNGSGIQHIALLTEDICDSVKGVKDAGIPTLDVPDTYYEVLNDRVPNITEDMNTLKNLRLLADGDDEGYLLQIFTQNVIGPIFYEFIQRKNHWGFGEGNFQALFEAIERDQRRRGVL